MERKEKSRIQKEYEKLEKQNIEHEMNKKSELQRIQVEFEQVQRDKRVVEEEKQMLHQKY